MIDSKKPTQRLNPGLIALLIFPIAGLIAAFSIALSGGGATNREPPAVAVTSDTLIGRAAPDFELDSLQGGKIRLSSLRGKPTFLNFWATYCAPCRAEMPAFQALIDGKILGDANVLTVNKGDSPEAVTAFFREINVALPTALDSTHRVSELYRVVNLPITYVLDDKGVIIDRQIGLMDADAIIAYLAKLKKG